MWHNLMSFDLPPLNLTIRALVIYFVVLLLLRISGKRQLGQMGATEFVSVLLISNAVQNSMNGGDNSMVGGILLATILIAASSTISFLTYRSELCRNIFEGMPRLVIHEGRYVAKALRREMLTVEEMNMLIRKQGLGHVTEIKEGVLEADGTLSLIRFAELEKK